MSDNVRTEVETKIRRFPVGEARSLDEYAHQKRREYLLLASEVANTVLLVNLNIRAPFVIREGERASLGLFVETVYGGQQKNLKKGQHVIEVLPRHQRHALVGRVLFSDKDGRIYRDLELKGSGFFEVKRDLFGRRAKVLVSGEDILRFSYKTGLLSFKEAVKDYDASEELSRLGIRTSRVVAIIGLDEIIVNRNKIKWNDRKDDEDRPVIEVRAFGSRVRIGDLLLVSEPSRLKFIADAKKLISQEQGLDGVMSDEEYLVWFARQLGENVGIMHSAGKFHGNLGDNVTLDCRIVDLASVRDLGVVEQTNSDLEDSVGELSRLISAVRGSGLVLGFKSEEDVNDFLRLEAELKDEFMEAYKKSRLKETITR